MITQGRKRFLTNVRKDGCWFWFGTKYPSGYGLFSFGAKKKRKNMRAHRAAWVFFKGPIPADLCVLHRCGVRNCVNPDHLYLGSHLDNAKDREADGRTIRGESSPISILDEKTVKQIRARYKKGGESYRSICKDYGVSDSAIGDVIRRKTWSHV